MTFNLNILFPKPGWWEYAPREFWTLALIRNVPMNSVNSLILSAGKSANFEYLCNIINVKLQDRTYLRFNFLGHYLPKAVIHLIFLASLLSWSSGGLKVNKMMQRWKQVKFLEIVNQFFRLPNLCLRLRICARGCPASLMWSEPGKKGVDLALEADLSLWECTFFSLNSFRRYWTFIQNTISKKYGRSD